MTGPDISFFRIANKKNKKRIREKVGKDGEGECGSTVDIFFFFFSQSEFDR